MSVRGEWMDKLLSLGQGIRKVRYYLSDEVLCLGCPNAPVTSEFTSGARRRATRRCT